MSATTRSTMMGVSSFRVASKSSVSAALPRSCSSSGTTSRSAIDGFLGQLCELLEVFQAQQEPLFMALAQSLQALAELDELAVAVMAS